MKKIVMSLALAMSLCATVKADISKGDFGIWRSGYSDGTNIEFNLTQDAFMVAFNDLSGDLETRIDQVYEKLEVTPEYIFLEKGHHKFYKKGYYFIKFTSLNNNDAIFAMLNN